MTVQQPYLSHPKYRPDIDGLRAVAVLAVVAFHAFPSWVRGGFIGVDVFFVISGYLISTIIFENFDRGVLSFAEFYVRRIKRIFPALLLVLISCFAFGWFALLADEYKQLGKHIASGAGFISNFILWNEADYFDNSGETKPLLHLWSLGIEEQFYIIWPFFLWFSWKLKFNLLILTIVVAIATFILNINGVEKDMVATFYSPQTRFWELLSGSLLSWFSMYKKDTFSNIKHKIDYSLSRIFYSEKNVADDKTLKNVLSFIGLFLLLSGFWRIDKELSFPGKWALVPVLGSVLIIAAGSKAWINHTILSNRVAVWFGLISFPLYLWHWPILSFVRIIESEVPSRNIRMAAVLLSIVLAWLTYRLVELPLRFGKHSKIKVTGLFVLMSVVGYFGYDTFIRDGYEFRSAIKGVVNNKNELVRTLATDSECLKFTGLKNPLFPYCRFSNASSDKTLAVIGDSHAHVAYPAIAEHLKAKGVNTLLLASSGCPPFLGSPTGKSDFEKDACSKRTNQLLDTIIENKGIERVLFFTRGAVYNTGKQPVTGDERTDYGVIPIEDFINSAQLTFNKLSANGKVVYYITENPELFHSAASCLVRPLKSAVKDCSVDKLVVLERQSSYLNSFNSLKNVTVINSLNAFCPESKCIVFDDSGSLLYADSDHLSLAGSKFQFEKLLRPFLE